MHNETPLCALVDSAEDLLSPTASKTAWRPPGVPSATIPSAPLGLTSASTPLGVVSAAWLPYPRAQRRWRRSSTKWLRCAPPRLCWTRRSFELDGNFVGQRIRSLRKKMGAAPSYEG